MQAIGTQGVCAGRAKPAAQGPARQPCTVGAAECSSRALPRHTLQRQQRRQQQARSTAAAAGPGTGSWQTPNDPSELNYDVEHSGRDVYGDRIGPKEVGVLDDDFYLEGLSDQVSGRKGGYTPYDFIDFTDACLKHEVVTRVEKPVSEVYALWCDRLNWPLWFSMIEEVGFKEGEEDLCALNMWYRWASTPWLELYVAMRRTQVEPNKYIVEEPEDGMPLVAAALFQEDGPTATLVTLRISYLLPRVLFEFAGQMAVYGDVDRKLSACMGTMKEWIEGQDTAEALAAHAAAMQEMRANLPEHRRQQAEADAAWEVEKQQRQQQRQQQAAAAAAQQAADSAAMAQALGAAAAVAEAEASPAAPKRRGRKPAGSSPVMNPMAKSKRGRKAADGAL